MTPAENRPADAAAPRRRISTRRRLLAAFAVVLAAFLAALAVQIFALGRMEATFAEMKDHEEEMRLALELEDAVRDQFHASSLVAGAAAAPRPYEAARSLVIQRGTTLSARLDEPEAIGWMREIWEAIDDLEPLLGDEAARTSGGHAAETLQRAYALVAHVEGRADLIFGLLQRETSRHHAELVALQAAALRWTAVLLLVTPLLFAGVIAWLSRSVARPLARLSEGAAALAAGDLGTRIDVATPDEFGALAAEFNAMTLALSEHQRRLVESEKLAGIGRVAAGVAHEINNPLQVILGYLSLNRDHQDRRLAAQLAAVEDEALRCKEIVDGLLELSRPALAPGPVDLRALCEDVRERLRATGPGPTHLAVTGGALALAEQPRLHQVVFNLMKNAVEAAGPGGDVNVRIRASGDLAEVAVEDSGPGLAPDARVRLFEPFFTTKPEGTGLGLAVSRAIARAHGGDIDVRPGDRGGAVFTLRLRRALEARS